MRLTLSVVLLLISPILVAPASARDWLSLGAKGPKNTILHLSGADTANASASARIEYSDALEHCENFSVNNASACASGLMETEAGRIYTASADCLMGTITTVGGNNFRLAGYWEGDWGHGRTKWKDADGVIVGNDNASNGLGISQQWEVLCPDAKPAIEVDFETSVSNGWVVGIDHNGSLMGFDEDRGVLYYEKPKKSLSGTVAPGTILFRGNAWSFEKRAFELSGTAYTFRQGCDPAPYAVLGRLVRSSNPNEHDAIVLRGDAPIRVKNGCRVVGYTGESSNSTLIFELHYGDI